MAAKDKAYKSFLNKAVALMAIAESNGVDSVYLSYNFHAQNFLAQNATCEAVFFSLDIVKDRFKEKCLSNVQDTKAYQQFAKWMKLYEIATSLYLKFTEKSTS